MSTRVKRPIALITGAAGGMGSACARLFGATHDLLLTDASARLDTFAAELRASGYEVVGAPVGDLGAAATLDTLTAALSPDRPTTLIHTAGVSPSQADWRTIMAVNLVATHRLLAAVEPRLAPGSVGIVIASSAGHLATNIPGAVEILADPLAEDFLDRIGTVIEPIGHQSPIMGSSMSYILTKQSVLGLVERKAASWAARGARIVSISPGLILTPMGQSEIDNTPGAAQIPEMSPLGRTGTAMEIALAAQFLASDKAGFITGADLRIDGGMTAATRP